MKELIEKDAALACFHDWVDKHGDVHAADEMPEYQAIENLPTYTREELRCGGCDQVQWERDLAIEQLKELGYGLGEKPRTEEAVDLSGYSDKLWKVAYERGKTDAQADLESAYAEGWTAAESKYRKVLDAQADHNAEVSKMVEWIPCSERLPEDGAVVLVTYKTTDNIHPCQYHAGGSINPWYSFIDQTRAYANVVLAWMPLPEPYKGEQP